MYGKFCGFFGGSGGGFFSFFFSFYFNGGANIRIPLLKRSVWAEWRTDLRGTVIEAEKPGRRPLAEVQERDGRC